jgi:SagB-type dehydrogenase family enzyme
MPKAPRCDAPAVWRRGGLLTLQSPEPRQLPKKYERFRFETRGITNLPPAGQLQKRLDLVIKARRSSRDFGGPLGLDTMSTLLWFSAKVLATRDSNPEWSHRPSASGGGIHPIHIVVCRLRNRRLVPYVYNPWRHSLDELCVRVQPCFAELIDLPTRILGASAKNSTQFWYVADFAATSARYRHPESLVWRDAGHLQSMLLIVAAGLGCNACEIGATGDPFLSKAFTLPSQIRATGGSAVGR